MFSRKTVVKLKVCACRVRQSRREGERKRERVTGMKVTPAQVSCLGYISNIKSSSAYYLAHSCCLGLCAAAYTYIGNPVSLCLYCPLL